jgi:hypothetical protein
MNLPPELDFKRLSDGEKYHRAVPGYMRRLRRIYEALHERFGEEGLELIREVSREFGGEIGENVKKGREVRGLAGVGRYLLRVFDMVSDDWKVAEYSEDRLIITVDRCPYPFTSDALCRAHTCMEHAIVKALDEDLEYRIGQSIPQGDVRCEHILERKGAAR